MSVSSYTPGALMQVGECPYAVEFPIKPQSSTDIPKNVGADRGLELFANWDANTALVSACACSNTLNWGEVPEAVAVQNVEWQLKSTGGKLSDVYFSDHGPDGKSLSATIEGSFNNGPLQAYGPLQLRMHAFYFGKCFFMVAGGGALGRYDEPHVARFLQSAGPIGAQPATSISPPPTDSRRRLEELKDLYDRNLITPQEYENRRKAILDAL